MAKDKSQDVISRELTPPAPDDERKPDSPLKVRRPEWHSIAKRTLREFSKDACPDMAAALTYHGVLSIFPALLALASLLGLVGQGERTTAARLDAVQSMVLDSVDVLKGPIEHMTFFTPTVSARSLPPALCTEARRLRSQESDVRPGLGDGER